jgi:transposase
VPNCKFTNSLQLPELYFAGKKTQKNVQTFFLQKKSDFEVCPKCASKSSSIHDHVHITIRDTPLRDKRVVLSIKKRRFRCPNCKSVFTEPIQGIRKGFRTTERFRKHIMWATDHFRSIKDVTRQLHCSFWLVHKAYYEQLDLQLKKIQNPWATTIGIDEHAIRKSKNKRYREFGTIFVEYTHRRVREIALGRTPGELLADERLRTIPGRENVANVIIDLSKPYQNFVKEFFPNARIIADRFHVIRLINVILNKYRKDETGDVRKNPIRKLLLKKSKDLEPWVKRMIREWLKDKPQLKQIYEIKERLHGFYNIKGMSKASRILTKITDDMADMKIPELQTLRRTLMRWREYILNFFENKLTNGRTEGFNRKAKLIQRNAYGFKNFENYRKRLIYSCR